MILVFKAQDNVFFIDKESDLNNYYSAYDGLINHFHLHFSFKPDGSMYHNDYVEFAYEFDIAQPRLYFDLFINALDFFIERNINVESFSILYPPNSSYEMLVDCHTTIHLFFKELKDNFHLLPVHLRNKITEVAYAKE